MKNLDKQSLPPCNVELALSVLSNKWVVLILERLSHGTLRFKDLFASLNGVSSKMLSQQLSFMQQMWLINRKAYPVIPPKVEYSLTPLGESLKPVLDVLEQWGQMYRDELLS
ncbi:helix-turn-helix domain-containing protein [Campylobacter sp. 19-13652]|uniref:winged helix-turn-helix transcriptional regulator n=1 Tax=Campylobacter sp. 19-13652 TaxID=2840180 RepID=UPI001C79A196|nr:helix-turn-helix domain-containing protein [Campylobacter sp. 19-13652]BCX80221.1 MarR family transcriptional regulator [Campylobacter sp. 19-13652]